MSDIVCPLLFGAGCTVEIISEQLESCGNFCSTHQCSSCHASPSYVCTNMSGDQNTTESRATLPYPFPLFMVECNPDCDCSSFSSMCLRRVVQQRLSMIPDGLQIVVEQSNPNFSGQRKVITSRDFLQGECVCVYLGEVLMDVEEIRERETLQKEKLGHTYLFSYQTFHNSSPAHPTPPPVTRFTVDAASFDFLAEFDQQQCVASFVNHSCEPNLQLLPVYVDHAWFPYLVMFAKTTVGDSKSGPDLSIRKRSTSGEILLLKAELEKLKKTHGDELSNLRELHTKALSTLTERNAELTNLRAELVQMKAQCSINKENGNVSLLDESTTFTVSSCCIIPSSEGYESRNISLTPTVTTEEVGVSTDAWLLTEHRQLQTRVEELRHQLEESRASTQSWQATVQEMGPAISQLERRNISLMEDLEKKMREIKLLEDERRDLREKIRQKDDYSLNLYTKFKDEQKLRINLEGEVSGLRRNTAKEVTDCATQTVVPAIEPKPAPQKSSLVMEKRWLDAERQHKVELQMLRRNHEEQLVQLRRDLEMQATNSVRLKEAEMEAKIKSATARPPCVEKAMQTEPVRNTIVPPSPANVVMEKRWLDAERLHKAEVQALRRDHEEDLARVKRLMEAEWKRAQEDLLTSAKKSEQETIEALKVQIHNLQDVIQRKNQELARWSDRWREEEQSRKKLESQLKAALEPVPCENCESLRDQVHRMTHDQQVKVFQLKKDVHIEYSDVISERQALKAELNQQKSLVSNLQNDLEKRHLELYALQKQHDQMTKLVDHLTDASSGTRQKLCATPLHKTPVGHSKEALLSARARTNSSPDVSLTEDTSGLSFGSGSGATMATPRPTSSTKHAAGGALTSLWNKPAKRK